MRRGLIALLVVFAFFATWTAPPRATAQQQLNVYPGNIVTVTTATVAMTNTAAATTLFTTSIPANYLQQFARPFKGAGSLHLKSLGTVSTNVATGAVGPLNLGCNYGGTTASISLVNGASLTANLSAVPVELDLYLRAQTATAPFLFGTFKVYSATGTTVLPFAASVVGTTSLASTQTLACIAQWSSAAATNSLTINHSTLVIGE